MKLKQYLIIYIIYKFILIKMIKFYNNILLNDNTNTEGINYFFSKKMDHIVC
jgi:hypothetical protein